METLVITSCIKPKKSLQKDYLNIIHKWTNDKKTINPDERYNIYKSNLLYYLNIKELNNIIFCDNSLFKIPEDDIDYFYKVATKNNKNFELLQFKWDDFNQKNYWYAYWEQEILDYIYINSKILKNIDNWYKISWRKKIVNLDKIIKMHNNIDDIFIKLDDPTCAFFTVSTYFFKISNKLYWKIFYNNVINYYKNLKHWEIVALENIWYFFLKISNIKINNFKILPIFSFFHIKHYFYMKFLFTFWIIKFWITEKILNKIFLNRYNIIKKKLFSKEKINNILPNNKI